MIGALVIGFLMVFVLPVGLVAGATSSSVGSSQTLWAYGSARTVAFSGTASDGWSYEGQATFGYSVILNQTNTSTSGNSFELSIHRVMGALFSVEFCFPTCGHAIDSANLSYHAWETSDAWANFTTLGSVTEGRGSVPAIALVGSHATVNGSLRESATALSPNVERSKYLSANVSGEAQVAFTTPLGLLPLDLNLSTPASWTSTSAFLASGASQWDYYYASREPLRNVTAGPASGSGTVEHAGNVTVVGSYSLGNSVTFDGITFPAIALAIEGPFTVREGLILVPSGTDLFGASSQAWSANQSGAATASMTYLDVRPFAEGHFGLAASSWLYDSASLNPADLHSGATVGTGIVPAVGAVEQAPPTTIQSVPQSVAQAQSTQSCLVSGLGCPAAPGTPTSHFWMVVIGLAIIALVIAAVVSTVVIAERRRIPPPVYPNAHLYPPGAAPPAARATAPRPPGNEPAPAVEDPLSHLW